MPGGGQVHDGEGVRREEVKRGEREKIEGEERRKRRGFIRIRRGGDTVVIVE